MKQDLLCNDLVILPRFTSGRVDALVHHPVRGGHGPHGHSLATSMKEASYVVSSYPFQIRLKQISHV
jgi:hypothetical protein